MRKFLVIFLLMLLPVQFSWSAVAGYCQHESGADAGHFGHHEHRHADDAVVSVDQASNMADEKRDATTAFVVDLDCFQCHGYCSAIVVTAPLAQSQDVADVLVADGDDAIATTARDRPERPKWLRLA